MNDPTNQIINKITRKIAALEGFSIASNVDVQQAESPRTMKWCAMAEAAYEAMAAPSPPDSAGRGRTREELNKSLMDAVKIANPKINILQTPDWILDWAEQLENRCTWFKWQWHNAVTAMQCAAWPDGSEDDQTTGGMQWIYDHLSQGMWPPEGKGAETLNASEYWEANAVPFNKIYEVSERAFNPQSTTTKEDQ